MKRRIKTILSLAVAAITATAAITAQAAQFSDISPDHWAYNSVTKMAERGVFSGYEDGTFRPGQAMTHEEFVKTIVEYVAPNSVTPKSADYQQVVTDDPSNPQYWTNHWASWAQPYLDKALELGLIGDGSDASNKKIATLLDDYDEIINGTPVTVTYPDDSSAEIASLEIDLDDTDNIKPDTLITREEAARLVTRALYLTRDNEHLYDTLDNTPFSYTDTKYTIGYKYAGYTIGYALTDYYIMSRFIKYQPNQMFAGIVCDLDVDTGSTDGNGIWGVTPGYRRDVIVAFLNGIIGTDENYMYNPQQSLTRAEAAAIMLRLSDKNERFAQAGKMIAWKTPGVIDYNDEYDEMYVYMYNMHSALNSQPNKTMEKRDAYSEEYNAYLDELNKKLVEEYSREDSIQRTKECMDSDKELLKKYTELGNTYEVNFFKRDLNIGIETMKGLEERLKEVIKEDEENIKQYEETGNIEFMRMYQNDPNNAEKDLKTHKEQLKMVQDCLKDAQDFLNSLPETD